MHNARYECPSATLRRTLKRRRSSMYEASGCASVTSASSAFSAALQLTAICASCKPTLLCSDGCGAAAVQSVCRCSCGQCTVSDGGFAHDRFMGHGYTHKSVCTCTLRACVRAFGDSLLLELARQVAACNMRRTACNMQHATRNMQRTTSILLPSHVWQMMRDLCRAASCCAQHVPLQL
jgi:hypothetical protein